MLRAAHPEKFPFEPFVRLLEQGEDDSFCYLAEADPEVLPKLFGLKEMKENIYGGGMTKVITKNGEGLDKGPAVGMQLGRGDVYLR